jgi:TRAP-type C4-dicarboxylate transport system permease small subunit
VGVVGSETAKHLRNIGIIVVLAVAVWKLPGGGEASMTISNLLWIVFVGGMLFFGYRMYMEHRDSIFSLTERQRGILYAALALATITLVATRRMWEDGGGLGAVLWLCFLGLSIYAIYGVWRAYREY